MNDMSPGFAADMAPELAPDMASEATHDFTLSVCMHLGRPCPAANRMLRTLAKALACAKDATEEGFEVTGESTLEGCDRSCHAKFQASHDRIRVFCGTEKDADLPALNRFADTMLSPSAAPYHGTAAPQSFGEARPLSPPSALI